MKVDEFIRKIPKAELSVHIEGTLHPELLYDLAKRNRLDLPFRSLEEVYNAYDFQGLEPFLKIYYTGLKVLQTEQDFYSLTIAYLEKAAAQNIRHTEFFFDPQAHLSRGIELDAVVNGIRIAQQEAQKKWNITSYMIMSFLRDLPEKSALDVLEKALPFKDWIVAIGLDSTEEGNPPKKFETVFAKAREHGFLTTAIAGEVGPPEYIRQAIDILKVSRIDHGVRCMEDPDLLTRLAATQIPINVCPVSNIELEIYPTMRAHPLKKMYDNGLFVTINSDDPAYFGADLNENFIRAAEALKLSKVMIYEIAKNSFNASFLESTIKEKYIAELDKFYKLSSVDVS